MECDKLWGQATKVVQKNRQTEFQHASMIKIHKGASDIFCYNAKIWRDKGWCMIEG